MRRRIGICLLAALMLAALMVPALAAPSGDTPGIYDLKVEAGYTVTPVTKADGAITAADGFYANAEKLTVVVNGATAGTFYLVTAQNATGVPTDSNLVYIDQQTGAATFKVYPSAMENDKTYYICVASNETSGALKQIASFTYYGGKAAAEVMLGDVNDNGKINSADAAAILKYVVADDDAKNSIIPTTRHVNADVNGNGKINSADAAKILQYVVADEADQNQDFFKKK